VIQSLGVSRTQSYELRGRLEVQLGELHKPLGRPKKPAPLPAPQVSHEVLAYLYEHPGAARARGTRKAYSDDFRLFILGLLQRHKEVSLESFAAAAILPLGTIKDWLRGGVAEVKTDDNAMPVQPDLKGPLLKTVLAEWELWAGSFTGFCDHLQEHCRVPWRRTMIQSVLEATGVRIPRRRHGRTPDEGAIRKLFETYFPHAQWEGDGSQIPVLVGGELFVFNLELNVDAYSGAFVGAALTKTEDAEAVITTFRDAIAATGIQPLSLVLDNKPSNHCEAVEDELGDDTLLIRSTPYRPQNKPHVEGGFGLLKPNLDGLELDNSGTDEQLAASYARGLISAVLRTLNHRPRKDRGGLSRVDLLNDKASPEQVEEARKALIALQAKQAKRRATLAARQDPEVRARLTAAYERLGLEDPKGHLLTSTARYPLKVVVEAIAIFEARQRRGTLPDGADARYLLGIARNLDTEWESWELALCLWAERVAAGDEIALRLKRQRDAVDDELLDTEGQLAAYLDRALKIRSRLDRFFWLTAAADIILDNEPNKHSTLFRLAARRIAATHSAPNRDRTAAIRFLAAKVKPLS
jgi:hypothetical protein